MRGKVRKTKLSRKWHSPYEFKTFEVYKNIQICSINAKPEDIKHNPFDIIPIYVDDPKIKRCETLENFWIYSKVYKCDVSYDGYPTEKFLEDRLKWFASKKTDIKRLQYLKKHMKDFLYILNGGKIINDYVEGRKLFYCKKYSSLVQHTDAYHRLQYRLNNGENLCLTSWGSADWSEEDDPKCEVLFNRLNKQDMSFGHASVLCCLLTGNIVWERQSSQVFF